MTGTQLRDLGLARIEQAHHDFLTAARKVLDALIKIQGRATIDEVRDILAAAGIYPDSSHAWGAVPAGNRYVCIGRQQSKRSSKRALWEMRELAWKVFAALPDDHRFIFADCMEDA